MTILAGKGALPTHFAKLAVIILAGTLEEHLRQMTSLHLTIETMFYIIKA